MDHLVLQLSFTHNEHENLGCLYICSFIPTETIGLKMFEIIGKGLYNVIGMNTVFKKKKKKKRKEKETE